MASSPTHSPHPVTPTGCLLITAAASLPRQSTPAQSPSSPRAEALMSLQAASPFPGAPRGDKRTKRIVRRWPFEQLDSQQWRPSFSEITIFGTERSPLTPSTGFQKGATYLNASQALAVDWLETSGSQAAAVIPSSPRSSVLPFPFTSHTP